MDTVESTIEPSPTSPSSASATGARTSSATSTSSAPWPRSATPIHAVEDSCRRQYQDVRFCRDFSAVLADPSIDAVALATPAVTHYEMAKAALEAGKDVFVEKPLAIDVRHGEALVELAAANGRILMVGHILSYHPAILKLQRADSERRARQDQLPLLEPPEHRQDPHRGEHPLELRAARHLRDAVAAERDAEPVSCQGGAYLNHDVADVTLSHFDFPSGVQAHIFVSWLHPVKEQRLVVVGSEKMAVFDDTAEHKLVLYPHKVEWKNRVPTAVKAERRSRWRSTSREPLRAECQHFLDCVASRTHAGQRRRRRASGAAVLDACQRALLNGGDRRWRTPATAATRRRCPTSSTSRPTWTTAPRSARARRSGTSRTS